MYQRKLIAALPYRSWIVSVSLRAQRLAYRQEGLVSNLFRGFFDCEKYWVFVGDQKEGPYRFAITEYFVFSSDGSRYAYGAQDRTGKGLFIVDGRKHEFIDDAYCRDFTFSPDSDHCLYRARDANGENRVFLDGKIQGPCDNAYCKEFIFSPDGSRYAYCIIDREDGKKAVFIDGKKVFSAGHKKETEDKYGNDFVFAFSPDSQHWACGMNGCLVVDGQDRVARKGLGRISQLAYSPDGQRLAYLADGGKLLVCDEEEWGPFREVREFVFSPDSRQLAYIVLTNRETIHHAPDYNTADPYDMGTDEIIEDLQVFSGDRLVSSQIHHYCSNLAFAPDSGQLAYIAGGKLFLDGQCSEATAGVKEFYFSPDSRNIIVFSGRGSLNDILVTVHGQKGKRHKRVFLSRDIGQDAVVFNDDGTFSYLMQRRRKVFLVTRKLT